METLRKFEGASLDELLDFVYRECGESARIVEANRIRRGGVGGFFAKEGFEVVVAADADGRSETASPARPSTSPATSPSPAPRADAGGPPARPAGSPRPWAQSGTSRPAPVRPGYDEEDELVGDVVAALDGVRSVADATSIEHAISREAAQRLRATRRPAPAPTPAPGDPLLGLVDEANGRDHREAVTFADALDQALAGGDGLEGPRPTGPTGPTGPTETTFSLDDLLELELGFDEQRTPIELPLSHSADPEVVRLAEDFIRQSDLAYREVQPVPAPTSEPAPETAPEPVLEPVRPVAPPTVFELITRYERVPAVPPVSTGPGVLVVVGRLDLAQATAEQIAGAVRGTQHVVATAADAPDVPAWTIVRSADEAADRAERWDRNGERVVVALDLGTGPSGLAWAKRLIAQLRPLHVRLATSTAESADDTQATIELLGSIDAIAVHTAGAPVDPDRLLAMGPPVATVDGHPASPALWAALTLEGINRHG